MVAPMAQYLVFDGRPVAAVLAIAALLFIGYLIRRG